MTIRNPMISTLAVLAVMTWLIADSSNSEAQLLRRLRSRIQSRVIAPPFPANPQLQPPNRRTGPPQLVPSQGTAPAAPSTAAAPRRVAPVTPTPSQSNPAQPEMGQPTIAAPGRIVNRPPNVQPPAANPASSQNPLGASILAGPASAGGDSQPGPTGEPGDQGPGDQSINPLTPMQSEVSELPSPAIAQSDKPSLGIQVVEARQGMPGLKVTGINPESNARESGLRIGDLIVAIEDQPTETISAIGALLSARRGGENVRLRIFRNRTVSVIDVPLLGGAVDQRSIGSVVEDSAGATGLPAQFGLRYRTIDGQRGALVTEIQPDSPASLSGLETGDRIVAVDGKLLIDAEALQRTLRGQPAGAAIRLSMVRDGKLMSAKIDPNGQAASNDSLIIAGGESPKNSAANSPLNEGTSLKGLGAALGSLLRGKPKSQPVDQRALGEDEGVRQADFEADTTKPVQLPENNDPLALETLEPPSVDQTKELDQSQQSVSNLKDSQKTPEQLRKEIAELEQRLKELLEQP